MQILFVMLEYPRILSDNFAQNDTIIGVKAFPTNFFVNVAHKLITNNSDCSMN